MTDLPDSEQEAEVADALREAAAFRLTGRATIKKPKKAGLGSLLEKLRKK